MDYNNAFHILQSIFNKEEFKKITETLIIQVPGGYELFGKYVISKNNNVYVVNKYQTDLNVSFYSVKNATIYTILYERNRLDEVRRILELDVLLEGTVASMERYKQQYQNGNQTDNRDISLAKFTEAKHKKYLINNEIDEYIKETKMWQESRFKQLIN